MMKFENWLRATEKKLESAGIGTARLDALVLAEDATGKNRAYLLAHPEHAVLGSTYHKLEKQIERRSKHEPLAYIRGKTEFYGRQFIVDKRVLEPRPESETMIDLVKTVKNVKSSSFHIIDVGTGSGALAITAKLELPDSKVMAVDIDPDCLAVTRQNIKLHQTDIKVMKSDLLDAIGADSLKDSILLCNLPYVPDDYQINQAAGSEPRIAIFGGKDGLELYRKLFSQIDSSPQKPRYVLTESLPFQHQDLADIAAKFHFKLIKSEDFIQLFEINQ